MFILPRENCVAWLGLPVQKDLEQLHAHYLERIHDLLIDCLKEHPRWTVIRVDLHVSGSQIIPETVIKRFIGSLKAQLNHVRKVAQYSGKRGYDPMLRYVWVREWSQAGKPHYHLALLINRDAYFSLGNYSRLNDLEREYDEMLAGRIYKAWGVALGVDWRVSKSGVYFPERPVSALRGSGVNALRQLYGVFYRLSYFAKLATKRYGEDGRNFGMSQLRCIQALLD